LKDKNGVEIYEGDIIVADWHWTEPHEVIWPNDYYWLDEVSLEGGNMEVIGNVYQNPEMQNYRLQQQSSPLQGSGDTQEMLWQIAEMVAERDSTYCDSNGFWRTIASLPKLAN
jgi:hypothetical protein